MQPYGTNDDGAPVHQITIGAGDLTARFLTRGALLQDLRLKGVDYSLTVGSDVLEDYFDALKYHGVLVAPVVNRIAGAQAEIGGVAITAAPNVGDTLLHSGLQGAWNKVWEVTEHGPAHVLFRLDIGHMEDGFPGERTLTARFTAREDNSLRLDLRAATDRPTFMNIANHSYWNLDGSADWSEHTLRLAADAYLPVSDALLPTGEVRDVTGTDYDFRAGKKPSFGAPLVDHCFVLSPDPRALRDVLWFTGASGITLTMATTEPGIQVYDGGGGARPGAKLYEAPAFEAQGWPDAMHHDNFPSVALMPGQTYATTTTWKFTR